MFAALIKNVDYGSKLVAVCFKVIRSENNTSSENKTCGYFVVEETQKYKLKHFEEKIKN